MPNIALTNSQTHLHTLILTNLNNTTNSWIVLVDPLQNVITFDLVLNLTISLGPNCFGLAG